MLGPKNPIKLLNSKSTLTDSCHLVEASNMGIKEGAGKKRTSSEAHIFITLSDIKQAQRMLTISKYELGPGVHQ